MTDNRLASVLPLLDDGCDDGCRSLMVWNFESNSFRVVVVEEEGGVPWAPPWPWLWVWLGV